MVQIKVHFVTFSAQTSLAAKEDILSLIVTHYLSQKMKYPHWINIYCLLKLKSNVIINYLH